MLPATLAQRFGVKELVEGHLDLRKTAGRANPGDKVLTLVMSALAAVTASTTRRCSWQAGRTGFSASR
jgi:hypothetical protein